MDVVYKEGLLHLLGVKFGKRTWRKMWTVLFKPSSSGVGRAELYAVQDDHSPHQRRIFAWQRIAPKKVVRLSDCISVIPAPEESCPPQCTALYLSTMQCTYTLASTQCDDWLLALCQLAFQRHPAELDKGLLETGNGLTMEDNDLYSSWSSGNTTADSDWYHVNVQTTDASRRCKLDGEYLVSLDEAAIELLDVNTSAVLYRWPYPLLRKVGRFEGGFSIAAGRRCDSGKGIFVFLSRHGPEIYQAIAKHCAILKNSQDSALYINVQSRSSPDPSSVQSPVSPAGPPRVSEPEQLYSTVRKPAKNVRPSSLVRIHVPSSRETDGEEQRDGDGGRDEFPEASGPDDAKKEEEEEEGDCIYYNVRRSAPARIKDQVEPEGDASQRIYSDVETFQLSPQTPSTSSPTPRPLPPQWFPSPLPGPQHHHPASATMNAEGADGTRGAEEEAGGPAPCCVTPTETPGSFKHRLAEIISKDLAKLQSPLPSGAAFSH